MNKANHFSPLDAFPAHWKRPALARALEAGEGDPVRIAHAIMLHWRETGYDPHECVTHFAEEENEYPALTEREQAHIRAISMPGDDYRQAKPLRASVVNAPFTRVSDILKPK